MPKVTVKYNIKSSNEKSKGQVLGLENDKQNTIVFYETDDMNTKVKFNYRDNILTRENNDLKMEFEFIENKITIGTIKIKEINKIFNINIETKKINRNNNIYEYEYIIEDELYKYVIEVK